MKQRIALLTLFLIALTGLTSAQIVFDDSSNVEFNTGLDLTGQSITGYYNNACPDGEAVTDIQDDGTLVCESISTGTTQGLPSVLAENSTADQNINLDGNTLTGIPAPSNADEPVNLEYLESQYEASGSQNLSQVLENGDVANQSIDLSSNNINSVGYIQSNNGDNLLLRGGQGGGDANLVAGFNSMGDNGNVVIGDFNTDSIGLGTASPDAFVDIEGGKLDLSSNNITNVQALEGFFSSVCSDGEAVTGVQDDGTVVCGSVSSSTESLSETLAAGNVANQSINLDENNLNFVRRLGIGTGSPDSDLEIEGSNTETRLSYESGGYGEIQFENSGDILWGSGSLGGSYGNGNSGSYYIYQYEDLDGNNVDAYRLYIDETGNVGIGTDSPSAQLDVDGEVDLSSNNITNVQALENFFSSACSSGEAVTAIQDDGTVVCESVSAGSAENLSETLAAGNIANQSIEFSAGPGDGIALGAEGSPAKVDGTDIAIGAGADADSTRTGSNGIAIGKDTEVVTAGLAIGRSAYADDLNTNAIGIDSSATGLSASAIGWRSEADGEGALALGGDTDNDIESGTKEGASATANGAVAIGPDSVASNEYEATFGNLQGQELDLNVTGNATIHGAGGLNMPNGIQVGLSSRADDSSDIAIGQNTEAEFELSGTSETAVGDSAKAVSGESSAFGVDSYAGGSGMSGQGSLALGSFSNASADGAAAIGSTSDASAQGAVAIGSSSKSAQQYTARFGSDSQAYDVDVTGDLNVGGELTGVSTGGRPEDLSETLAEGNIANQSIGFSEGIEVYGAGGSTGGTTTDTGVAIGNSASSGGIIGAMAEYPGVSIGDDADSAGYGVALGTFSEASGEESIAIGGQSWSSNALTTEASLTGSVALGSGSKASSQKAVAIGYEANSPNSYEVTFGNLDDDQLDLNVTGNATIHGSGGFDMPNGVVIGSSSTSAGGSDQVAVGEGASASDTGAVALGEDSTSSAYYSVAIGEGSEALANADVALGYNSTASGLFSTALGRASNTSSLESTALGYNSSASARGAVAIGESAIANQSHTARFGSDSEPYDVEVTGDLSVDGRVNEQNVRDISYSSGHTAWSSGLSTEEVNRFGATSTESVEVERLDVQLKGGGTNSNFEVEAYDAGSSTVLGSTTAGTPINDVGTTSEGGDLTIRVTNSDGSDVTASITVIGHVVE